MEQDFSTYLKLINNCDSNDPLLSSTNLGKRLDQIPLECVNPKELAGLYQSLNVEQLIRAESGLARDYRGLAELLGFSATQVETQFKKSNDPTKFMLHFFINKNLTNNTQSHIFSLNDLLKMIETIERFDIIDDLLPTLIRLASDELLLAQINLHYCRKRPQDTQQDLQLYLPTQNGTTSGDVAPFKFGMFNEQIDNSVLSDTERLTIDDTNRVRTLYDAFVSHAPEDSRHAQELILLLEEHGKRVATVDDLLPGHFEHEALVKLIDMRCRKVIIILTPNFLRSKECEFQTKFASEISIQAGCPKIIPVLCESCDDARLPYMIRVISKIDMTNRQAHRWQIKKLLSSLSQFPDSQSLLGAPNMAQLAPSHPNNDCSNQDLSLADAATYFDDDKNQSESVEPIVELLHSRNSDSTLDKHNWSPDPHSQVPGPESPKIIALDSEKAHKIDTSLKNGGTKMCWFKSVRRKMMGKSGSNESVSPCTSSRATLLANVSSDCLSSSNIYDSRN